MFPWRKRKKFGIQEGGKEENIAMKVLKKYCYQVQLVTKGPVAGKFVPSVIKNRKGHKHDKEHLIIKHILEQWKLNMDGNMAENTA